MHFNDDWEREAENWIAWAHAEIASDPPEGRWQRLPMFLMFRALKP